jgi:uncharacterized protein (TIGR04255 family)
VVLNLPELDRRKLAHPPLTSVICQVRYEVSLRASDAKVASAFHGELGGVDGRYPNITPIIENQLNLALLPNAPPSFGHQSAMTGWRLSDENGSKAISLLPRAVALEVSTYDGWDDDFAPQLAALLAAVERHVEPVFEQRLGLRYINQISEPPATEASDWQEWIDPQILGIAAHGQLGPLVKFMRQQVVLQVGDDARCTLNHGFAEDPEREGALTYLLDIDTAREGVRPFDVAGIAAAASEFNSYALRLFQLAITPALRERLLGQ